MSDLFIAGKYHKREMIRLKSEFIDSPKDTKIRITFEMKKDLSFWLLIAKATKHGLPISLRSLHPPVNKLVYWTDAAGPSLKSDNGLGAVRFATEDHNLPPFALSFKWPRVIQEMEVNMSMSAMELLGALFAVVCDIKAITNKTLLFRIDNSGSVRIWRKGYSTQDSLSSVIVKAIFDIATASNSVVYCTHVPRRSTPGAIIADDFSKGKFVTGLVPVIGLESIVNGWKFPTIPQSLLDWIKNPSSNINLGSTIMEDLCRDRNPPLLLGYNIVPYRIGHFP